MSRKYWPAAAVLAGLMLGNAWLARAEVKGDPVKGKKVFLMEDADGVSCAKCHPKGHTNHKTIHSKKVPDLTERVAKISEQRLIEKTHKHLDRDMNLTLTDEQFNDLVAFVRSLPDKGYGDE